MKKEPLADRLLQFQASWISNPAAQMDFYNLLDELQACEDAAELAQVFQLLRDERLALVRIGIPLKVNRL